MCVAPASKPEPKSRLAHELKTYGAVSFYLFLCFGLILVYDASRSADTGVAAVALGTAAIKALVMGKFILIGELFLPGTRMTARTALHRIAWRSLGMLMVLVLLTLLEELVIGLLHGQKFDAIFSELAGKPLVTLLAPVLLMLLILVPLMTVSEVDKALGNDGLKGLLLRGE
jgi:hypothetical protein